MTELFGVPAAVLAGQVLLGLINGSFYALLSLGLAIIFGMLNVINFSHGALAALPAALKQATYTFFVAGFIVRLCEKLAKRSDLGTPGLILAVIAPTALAVGLTYLVHSLRGTPEPLWSTVPTLLSTPPFFAVWAWRSRRAAEGQPA